MGKRYGGRSYSGSASSRDSSAGRGSGQGGSTSRGVSAARLSQKSGTSNAYGGYAKVNHGDGSFSMRRTGR